jgi:hypothetical protein
MEGVLNGYVTNPNPTPTLTPNPNPNPNRNPNSNPNQINEKIQKETTLEIDQITKCQFGRWKLVKTVSQSLSKPPQRIAGSGFEIDLEVYSAPDIQPIQKRLSFANLKAHFHSRKISTDRKFSENIIVNKLKFFN